MSKVNDQKNIKRLKYVVLNKEQSYALDKYLRENFELFHYKCSKDIANECFVQLGYEIPPSSINGSRNAMIAAGDEVWKEPEQRLSQKIRFENMSKQLLEQETLITRLYARVIEIENYMEAEKDYHVANEEFGRKQGGGNGTALAV